jgi:hypothetical protein
MHMAEARIMTCVMAANMSGGTSLGEIADESQCMSQSPFTIPNACMCYGALAGQMSRVLQGPPCPSLCSTICSRAPSKSTASTRLPALPSCGPVLSGSAAP